LIRLRCERFEEYYVKEIRFDRTDGLRGPIEVAASNADTAFINVVLSSRVANIEGAVTDNKLQPFAGAQVILIPDRNRERAELYKTATTDQTGRFTLRGIAPGDYKLYAWEALENFAYFDPDLVKRSEPFAKVVHLDESSSLTIETKVIPTER
jgi:hypothetical protein